MLLRFSVFHTSEQVFIIIVRELPNFLSNGKEKVPKVRQKVCHCDVRF
jgi:hypothetical protein